MQVTVTIRGQSAVISGINAKIQAMKAKVGATVQTAGLLCEGLAKANCPVDTGLLRSSINYQQTGPMSCSVGTPTKYGPYVEFGTYKMRAQPYLFPAFLETSRRLQAQLKQL